MIVWGERESDDALAVRTRADGQTTKSLAELLAGFDELVARGGFPRLALLRLACKVGAVTLTSGATSCAGSTETNGRGERPLPASGFVRFRGGSSTVLKRDTAW